MIDLTARHDLLALAKIAADCDTPDMADFYITQAVVCRVKRKTESEMKLIFIGMSETDGDIIHKQIATIAVRMVKNGNDINEFRNVMINILLDI